MYTDGETFYYRSEQQSRAPERKRVSQRPAEAKAVARDDSDLVERLKRLEARSEELQSAVSQLNDALVRLTNRPEPRPPAAHLAQGAHLASAEMPVKLKADAPAGLHVTEENTIKASVFAGGSATALLGAVRFQLDEE